MLWMSIFSFFTAYIVCAQELTRKELPDTLKRMSTVNQSLLHSFDTILTPSSLLRKSSLYSTWYLHQSLTNFPSSLSSQFQQQIDVISPWKQELAKENDLRMLKMVLGAVQAGGTAYILYEHIRKYGLK
jgi:hypothetical protein